MKNGDILFFAKNLIKSVRLFKTEGKCRGFKTFGKDDKLTEIIKQC